MSVTIREYQSSDLEVCRDLWRDLTQRHRDIYEDQSIGGDDPGPYFDEHYLTDRRFRKLFLAEVDGEVVGMAGLLFDEGEAELEPIVVRPAVRSDGVGAQLAQRVVEEARALDAYQVNVRPVWRNVEAIEFFQREGFTHLNHIELTLRLGSPPARGRTIDVHGTTFTY